MIVFVLQRYFLNTVQEFRNHLNIQAQGREGGDNFMYIVLLVLLGSRLLHVLLVPFDLTNIFNFSGLSGQ